ncbi:MAG: hypothetical protein ACRDBL_04020 [Rhabdaerophilum sp.]
MNQDKNRSFDIVLTESPDKKDEQIAELQQKLAASQDARREDLFLFIVVSVILLDIVFFSVMPTFGGPIALVLLQALILVPLARRMGMEEVAQLLSRVLDRLADKAKRGE